MIRIIKIFDIGYIAALYFILGIISIKLFDYVFGQYDPKKDDAKSIYQIGFELIGMIWIFGIFIYIVRNIVAGIPSPFDKLFGFDHYKVKELGFSTVYTLILMGFSYHFQSKMVHFNKRLHVYLGFKENPPL